MAKLRETKVKYTTGAYTRVFGDEELGNLIARMHSTAIATGWELAKIIFQKTNSIPNLDKFIAELKVKDQAETYVCSPKTLRHSRYHIKGKGPDFLVITTGKEKVCRVIKLQDKDTFSPKRAANKKARLADFAKEFDRQTPFITDYYICYFNHQDKVEIVAKLKSSVSLQHVMTGQELCDILGISYEDILKERKSDAQDNLVYATEQIYKILAAKEIIDAPIFSKN